MPLITSIPAIPEIPEELRIASKQGRLLPFVGAGVSQLAGCPGWAAFADQCLMVLLRQNKLNHALLDQIRARRLSPRISLALALEWAKVDKPNPIDFKSILHPEDWAKHEEGNRVYRALSALSMHFVTTNYDFWLDTIPPASATPNAGVAQSATSMVVERTCIYKPEKIFISELDKSNTSTVTHLHGSLRDPDHMVLTTSHYIDRYREWYNL